jgi:hypothetical protein
VGGHRKEATAPGRILPGVVNSICLHAVCIQGFNAVEKLSRNRSGAKAKVVGIHGEYCLMD